MSLGNDLIPLSVKRRRLSRAVSSQEPVPALFVSASLSSGNACFFVDGAADPSRGKRILFNNCFRRFSHGRTY